MVSIYLTFNFKDIYEDSIVDLLKAKYCQLTTHYYLTFILH